MKLRLIILIFISVLIVKPIFNDWLYTVDDKKYEGKFVAFKYNTIYFNVYKFDKFFKSMRFPLYKVWKIEFNSSKSKGSESSFEIESSYKKFRKGKRVRKIIINGNEKWKNTGISVKIGQDILFNVKGVIYINSKTMVYPYGELKLKWDNNKPLPNQPTGSLIAKIGEKGKPFYIGDDKAPFRISSKGTLYIGINDSNFNDNSGKFEVTIYY